MTLTRPFLVARTTVTQAAWTHVMRTSPSRSQGDDLPVEMVSWEDAKSFCDLTGLGLPTSGNFTFGGPGNSIGLMADGAGNSAPISLTGGFNAVSRAASFSANGTFSNVAGFGSASLNFSSSGTVSGVSNEVKAAVVNFTCTGPGCQTPLGKGVADIFFLRSASGIKALVANGGLVGATAPGNRVVFIGAGRCISGPC